MQNLNISLIQADLYWEDPERNLDSIKYKLAQILPSTDLIILPEMFNTGFTMNVDLCAEPMDGTTVCWMKSIAAEKEAVIGGSVLIEESGLFYNRFMWVSPDGSFDYYDKRHLFSMAGEDKVMSRGMDQKIVNLNGWNISLQVCYDLRFPVWSKNNFKQNKHAYDAMIYIANWPESRNNAYKKLLPARAIENQCYLVWVNRVGIDGKKIKYSGDSIVLDAEGKTLAQAHAGREQIINSTLFYSELVDKRENFAVGRDWDNFNIVP